MSCRAASTASATTASSPAQDALAPSSPARAHRRRQSDHRPISSPLRRSARPSRRRPRRRASHRTICPCCGGRMRIIETFAHGARLELHGRTRRNQFVITAAVRFALSPTSARRRHPSQAQSPSRRSRSLRPIRPSSFHPPASTLTAPSNATVALARRANTPPAPRAALKRPPISIGPRLAARASPTRGFLLRLSDAGPNPQPCISPRVKAGVRNPTQDRSFRDSGSIDAGRRLSPNTSVDRAADSLRRRSDREARISTRSLGGQIRTRPVQPFRPTAAQSTSAERRSIMVMFCDLVGSTSLASRPRRGRLPQPRQRLSRRSVGFAARVGCPRRRRKLRILAPGIGGVSG